MNVAIPFRMFHSVARMTAFCAAAFLCGIATAQNSSSVTPLSALYESETDAVRKARAFPKFGEALFAQIRKDVEASHYPAALSKLEDYIARTRAMRLELKAAVPDAEKKPSGFKQLQIHVRKSVRTLDHTIVSIPVSDRSPFVAGRREMEAIDRDLMGDLFPRQPGRKEPDKKEKP